MEKQSFRGGERAVTARKNRIRLVGALLVLVLSLSLVGCAVREGSADDGRLRVVTTLFPYYDFARALRGAART